MCKTENLTWSSERSECIQYNKLNNLFYQKKTIRTKLNVYKIKTILPFLNRFLVHTKLLSTLLLFPSYS